MSVTTGTFPGVRIVDMPDLGAFNDSSSVVGERAGSGRFSAPQLRSYITAGLPWTNVRDWGAKGDGATDDTAAFNAALASIAGAGGNGKLIIPAGNYRITGPLSYASGYLHVEGAGPGSVLSLNNPTSDLFTFAGTNITLSDFRVLTPYATSTHGGLFNFTSANFIRLDRITTNGGFGVVQFLGSPGNLSYRTSITNCHFDNVMGNGVFYDAYFGGFGMISDTEIQCTSTLNTGGNGIIIEAGDTFTFTNLNVSGFPIGIEVTSQTGGINYAANMFFANVLCDGAGVQGNGLYDGFVFNSSAAGTFVGRIHLSGCWGGAMQRHGFNVVNAYDVTFSNCIGIANGGHGFLVGTPSADITLDACTATGNSAGNANVNDGIHVVGPVTDFTITSCRSKPIFPSSTATQRYGVFIDGSANNRYIVSNNNLLGNLTAGLADNSAGSPTRFVSQNII